MSGPYLTLVTLGALEMEPRYWYFFKKSLMWFILRTTGTVVSTVFQSWGRLSAQRTFIKPRSVCLQNLDPYLLHDVPHAGQFWTKMLPHAGISLIRHAEALQGQELLQPAFLQLLHSTCPWYCWEFLYFPLPLSIDFSTWVRARMFISNCSHFLKMCRSSGYMAELRSRLFCSSAGEAYLESRCPGTIWMKFSLGKAGPLQGGCDPPESLHNHSKDQNGVIHYLRNWHIATLDFWKCIIP